MTRQGIEMIGCVIMVSYEAGEKRQCFQHVASKQLPIGANVGKTAAILIAIATAALIVAPLLWRAHRCTGPTQADLCAISSTANTSVNGFPK